MLADPFLLLMRSYCCARPFVRMVNQWLWEMGVDEVGVNQMCWMDEDDGGAFIELFPDWSDVGVAEVSRCV